MWNAVFGVLRSSLLVMAIVFVYSNDAISQRDNSQEDEPDTIAHDPRFINDLDAIRSLSILVDQPDNITYEGDGMARIQSAGTPCYRSADLAPECTTSAHKLLEELVSKYPLQRSFRSIQEDWLLAPFYSVSYWKSPECQGKPVFRIQIYGALTPQAKMELRHESGGRSVNLKGETAAAVYSFFALCLAEEHPETARALRMLAEHAAPSTGTRKHILPHMLLLISIVFIVCLGLWFLVRRKRAVMKRGRKEYPAN